MVGGGFQRASVTLSHEIWNAPQAGMTKQNRVTSVVHETQHGPELKTQLLEKIHRTTPRQIVTVRSSTGRELRPHIYSDSKSPSRGAFPINLSPLRIDLSHPKNLSLEYGASTTPPALETRALDLVCLKFVKRLLTEFHGYQSHGLLIGLQIRQTTLQRAGTLMYGSVPANRASHGGGEIPAGLPTQLVMGLVDLQV
jgi:hypothetical protein